MKRKSVILLTLAIVLIGFLAWRFIRPMNIFVVDDRFAWPIDTSQTPPVLGKLGATECAACHQDFYEEWQTTIHARAWSDPYFQTDWQFDDAQHSCRLCHTPLDRQLPRKVLGYRDKDKWDPIRADNPEFDPKLQHEGVTCAACHYREGKIVGDVAFGQAVKDLLGNIDIDWEELLSNVIGDIAAHQVGRGVRGLKNWGQHAAASLQQDLAELLQQEMRVLPQRVDIEQFLDIAFL